MLVSRPQYQTPSSIAFSGTDLFINLYGINYNEVSFHYVNLNDIFIKSAGTDASVAVQVHEVLPAYSQYYTI